MVRHAPAIDVDDIAARAAHEEVWARLNGGSDATVVERYTRSLSIGLNRRLRDGDASAVTLEQTAAIRRVQLTLPLIEAGFEVWRGLDSGDFLGDLDDLEGKEFVEHGFLSTSRSRDAATTFVAKGLSSVLMRIVIGAPAPAVYVPWTPCPAWAGEDEVILPPGCCLRINHVGEPEEGQLPYRRVDATLFPPSDD